MLWFDTWVLRQKLAVELLIEDFTINGKVLHVPNDLERQIDDFILLVVLCGNDFLPALPLPGFDIHEGSITKIIAAWKKASRISGGYIVSHGELRLDRLRELFRHLAELEGEPPKHAGQPLKKSRKKATCLRALADAPDSKDVVYQGKPSQTPEIRLVGNQAKMFMPQKKKVSTQFAGDLASLGIPIAGENKFCVKKSAAPDGEDEYLMYDPDKE